jgi:hypothetical protein
MTYLTPRLGRAALWLLLGAAALNPGCLCNGNGHVDPKPFRVRAGDDVVNCNCNLTFDNSNCSGGTCLAHFSIPLCLPPNLIENPDAGTETFDLGPVDDGGILVTDYAQKVDSYCKDVVPNIVYHMIKVFNGGWCDYKAPFAPNGGVGDSVECFAEELIDGHLNATALDDGTCMTPCDAIACDFDTNCGSDVQDEDGTIHLDRCKCSQVTRYGCPGDPPDDLPTAVFCRPPPNVPLN